MLSRNLFVPSKTEWHLRRSLPKIPTLRLKRRLRGLGPRFVLTLGRLRISASEIPVHSVTRRVNPSRLSQSISPETFWCLVSVFDLIVDDDIAVVVALAGLKKYKSTI